MFQSFLVISNKVLTKPSFRIFLETLIAFYSCFIDCTNKYASVVPFHIEQYYCRFALNQIALCFQYWNMFTENGRKRLSEKSRFIREGICPKGTNIFKQKIHIEMTYFSFRLFTFMPLSWLFSFVFPSHISRTVFSLLEERERNEYKYLMKTVNFSSLHFSSANGRKRDVLKVVLRNRR